ncbi:MAG: hypothetical protein AAGA55_12185 [Planctomycetota bacterium]
MRWRGRTIGDLQRSAGERFRTQHSAWLTRAMLSDRSYPRIPAKRTDLGGFDSLRRRPGGLQRAAAWWRAALAKVNDVF